MERIADNLADEAVKELVGKNKSQQISDSIAQLHAQVYKNTIGTGSTKTGGRIRRQGQGDEE